MLYDQFQRFTTDFNARWLAITNNPDLSGEGKQRQLQRLAAEKNDTRPLVVRGIAKTWADIRAGYSANKAARKAAEEAQASRWDFQRLNYETGAVRAAIDLATSQADIKAAYAAARASGDTHKARAWAETGPAVIRQRFGGEPGLSELTQQMAADLQALTTTPELEALDKASRALIEKAMDAEQYAKSAADFYGNSGNDVTEFYRQSGGASVVYHRAYNPTTGDLGYYTLVIDGE